MSKVIEKAIEVLESSINELKNAIKEENKDKSLPKHELLEAGQVWEHCDNNYILIIKNQGFGIYENDAWETPEFAGILIEKRVPQIIEPHGYSYDVKELIENNPEMWELVNHSLESFIKSKGF